MAELVDALDSKSCSSNRVRVQVPLRPPDIKCAFGRYFLGGEVHVGIKIFFIPNNFGFGLVGLSFDGVGRIVIGRDSFEGGKLSSALLEAERWMIGNDRASMVDDVVVLSRCFTHGGLQSDDCGRYR